MLYLVPYRAEHFRQLTLQPAQQWMLSHVRADALAGLESDYATTIMQDGKPVLCGGALPIWENRALLWSFVSGDVCAANFRTVHGFTKQFLAGLPFRRLEAAVDADFSAGHRWVKALGFVLEAPVMRAFHVNGSDCALYARVRQA